MKFLQLLTILLVSLSLFLFIDCSKKKEDISADEIIDQAEKDAAAKAPAPVEAVKPAVPEKSEPVVSEYTPRFTEKGRYVVQVRAYPSEASAKHFMQKLLDKGYPAYLAEVNNPTPDLSGTYYRVRVGGFSGVGEAREFGEKALTEMGYQYWVDNKSNDNIGKGYSAESGASPSYPSPSPSSSPSTGSGWSPPAATTEPAAPQATTPAAPTAPAAPASSNWSTTTTESSTPAAATPAPSTPSTPATPASSTPASSAPPPSNELWGSGTGTGSGSGTGTGSGSGTGTAPAGGTSGSGSSEFEF